MKVKLWKEGEEFLEGLGKKVGEKMIRNIGKWRFVVDGDLLKKLDDRDMWELRRLYKKRK